MKRNARNILKKTCCPHPVWVRGQVWGMTSEAYRGRKMREKLRETLNIDDKEARPATSCLGLGTGLGHED